MSIENRHIRQLRLRLAEITRRAAIIDEEQRFIEGQLRDAQKFYAAVRVTRTKLIHEQTRPIKGELALAFDTRPPRGPQGPKDTLRQLVRDNDGIQVGPLLDMAVEAAQSAAKDKRRTMTESLRFLRKAGEITRDARGGHHIGR